MDRQLSNKGAKSMDSEREKFRTYVEKSGVMSALTDVLVRLYEEPDRPSDGLAYVKDTLGSVSIDVHQLQLLESKVKEQESVIKSFEASLEAKDETIKAKEEEIVLLKERLAQLECKEEPNKVPPEGPKNA